MHAVFLDRDGVINVERADYVKSWQEFVFLPGTLSALNRLAQIGCPILVVTNQSVIGRSIVSSAVVDDVHRRMCATIAAAGGRIDAVYVCPHRPDQGCACRKPRPGLLQQAAAEFRLDLTRCTLIGDSITDLLAAHAVGSGALWVQSDRQGPQSASPSASSLAAEGGRTPGLADVPVFANLAEAVAALMAPAGEKPTPD